MKDYNIEYACQAIHSEKTKEYFKEVSSSYFNNNYRAAVVTLYSVVINDIIAKLEELDDIYSDSKAKEILNKTRKSQNDNPNSSDWEKQIIEDIRTQTSLIDNVDYAHILSLRNDRHLCAHPVIDKEDKLYTPNRETVASHIRNMFESLLLKPPILSKKILSTILTDIASKKGFLIDEASVEKYIKSKYLNSLNPTVELSIFRELWKFVFKLDDSQSNSNRLINYNFLELLYKRNISQCIQKIKSDKNYYSNVSNSKSPLNLVIRFISNNEFLYNDLQKNLHLLIEHHVINDVNAKTVAWFLSKSYVDHIEVVKKLILSNLDNTAPYDPNEAAYKRLLGIGIVKGHLEEVLDFIIWRYANSKNFNDGDKVFRSIVRPYLDHFTKKHFDKLCSKINEESQVCNRGQSEEDHEELKNMIITKTGDVFEFNNYPNIFNNLL